MVSQLIDPVTNQWDENLVRDIFWPIDAEVILCTPTRDDFEDFVAWHYDEKGCFSVKSAYHLYVRDRRGMIQSSSTQPEGVIKWEKIWKLSCPPKIKQFIWRLAHNSLPVKRNIKRKGIECDTLCVCCRRLDEDCAHLFLRCKEVTKIWRELKLENIRNQMCQAQDGKEAVQELLNLTERDSVQVCCLLWCWWGRRNKINAKENVGPWEHTVGQIRTWTAESLQHCGKLMKEKTERPGLMWQAPIGDVLKINIDGAYHAAQRKGGWGFVVRDRSGSVRGSGAGVLPCVASAIQAEAHACTEAVYAAMTWGMVNVQIESDSQVLLRAIQSNDLDLTPEGVIYRDLRVLLQLNFNQVSFSFAPRACNNLAHCLAAYGASRQDSRLHWSESLPDDVRVMVASKFAEPGV
jgi:hypothetical protein